MRLLKGGLGKIVITLPGGDKAFKQSGRYLRLRRTLGQLPCLQVRFQCPHDVARNIVLHLKVVIQRPVVLTRPQVCAVAGPDQLRDHADRVAGTTSHQNPKYQLHQLSHRHLQRCHQYQGSRGGAE